MTTIKNFFALLLLVAAATISNISAASAQTSGNPAIVFNAENIDEWNVKTIPATVRDGQTVLATSKTGSIQVIAVVRGGKIAQIGTKAPGGKFKVLLPSTGGPCTTIHCFANQASHCFQFNGQCVCVCGAFTSNYPGNN